MTAFRSKLKHWCGIWSKNGLEAAPMLEFEDAFFHKTKPARFAAEYRLA